MKGLDYNVRLPSFFGSLTVLDQFTGSPCRLLPLVRCCGDSEQHHDEEDEPFALVGFHHGLLGSL